MKIEKSARKIKRGDVIKIGGSNYRVTMLNLRFGGRKKHDRVMIHCHRIDDTSSSLNLSVPATETFVVIRKKK